LTTWTTADIPDLSGRVAIVTGASSGIGTEAALALAAHGAQTVLAVRDAARGNACAARIRGQYPGANVQVAVIDLADLASVRSFAERISETVPRIDILLNNAGLGMQAKRAVTVDGFERQFGTNHLGHFALTGLLIPALLRAPAPRVATISSIAHRRGKIDFNDLQTERPYDGRKAYGQSKLANLMFALELDRRARQDGSRLVSVAAHPGVSSTGFIAATGMPGLMVRVATLAIGVLGQSAARGALPGLHAATAPDIAGGQYWGPDGLLEVRGDVAPAAISVQAQDRAVWQRLWTVSEELTGVTYPSLS